MSLPPPPPARHTTLMSLARGGWEKFEITHKFCRIVRQLCPCTSLLLVRRWKHMNLQFALVGKAYQSKGMAHSA